MIEILAWSCVEGSEVEMCDLEGWREIEDWRASGDDRGV